MRAFDIIGSMVVLAVLLVIALLAFALAALEVRIYLNHPEGLPLARGGHIRASPLGAILLLATGAGTLFLLTRVVAEIWGGL